MSNEVREALEGLAARLGGQGARVADLQRLSGGASMETWAFAVEGQGGREEMILRRRSAPMDPEASR